MRKSAENFQTKKDFSRAVCKSAKRIRIEKYFNRTVLLASELSFGSQSVYREIPEYQPNNQKTVTAQKVLN